MLKTHTHTAQSELLKRAAGGGGGGSAGQAALQELMLGADSLECSGVGPA